MKADNPESQKKEKPSSDDNRPAQDQDKPHYAKESTGGRPADDSREKNRTLFENMAPGVFYQRQDGSLFDVNPAALRIFGLTEDQFIGKDSYDPQWKVISETGEVLAPEQHPSMLALLTGKPVRDRVAGVFNPERNDITWVRTNATPMFKPGETRPYQVFVTMDDITELRRVHASLTDSEEKFRELFARMPAAVAIYEVVGDGEDFIFRDFNAAAEAIEGIKKSDLVGKRVSEVFPGVIEFGLFDVFRRVGQSGEAEYYPAAVYRDHRDPGTWRENWVYKLATGEIIAIYHDITERKRAEEEIKKAYALVNETQAISRVGGWEYDVATKRLTWTDEVYRIHGVGKDFDPNDITRNIEFYSPDDRGVVQEAFRRAVEYGEPYDLELELMPADGGRIWVRTIGRPVKEGDRITRISGNIVDISDRKTAESALRESEERFSNAFRYATIGMALISPEGRWIRANQSICEIVGYSENELQGMTFQDITHPDDLDTDLEYVRQMIAGEIRTYQMEKRYFHKLGHMVWVLLSVSLVRDNQGKPRYFISQIENITERKRADEARRETAERLSLATQAGGVGIWELDLVNNILIWDDQMFQLYGITPEAFSGTYEAWCAGVHPDDLPRSEADLQLAIGGEKEFDTEFRVIWPDGSIHYLHANARVHHDASGKPKRLLGTNYDITERRQAEEALKESEERLSQITENSPVVYYVHDRASNMFIYVSLSYEKIWGRPCQELYENPYSFLEAIDPDDMPSVQEAIRLEFEEGKYFDREYRIIQPGGKTCWVHSRNFPVLDKQGTVYRVIGIAEDITQRKEAEDARRASEERFRKIFENSPVGMALVTPDFRFYSVNPAWVSMTGYPEPELLNLSFADITHPDHLAGDMEHIQELLAGTIPVYSTEKRYIRKDGSILWGSIRVTTIRDQHGSLLFLAAQVEDITERKLAEDALKESEEKLAMVIDGVPILIAYVDTELRFVYMNKAYADWFGRTREELIGNLVKDLLDEDVFERALPAYQAALGGKAVSMENHVRDTRGNERFVSVGLVPHFSGKDVRGFFASIMDITDRRVAEKALTESEVKFRTMVEASPDIIWEIDTQGNFTYISSQCQMQLGYKPGELIGQSFFSLIRPDFVSSVKTAFLEHIQENSSFSTLEVPAHNKEGNLIFIEIRSVPIIGSEGKVTGFRGIARDITTQKNSEKVLIALNTYNRSLIEASLDPLVTISYDGKIQDVNSATENVTGYSRSELIGTDFSDYFVDTVKARESYQEVFCKGIVRDYPLEIRHRGGSIKAVLYNATLYRDPQGNPLGVFAAARDISELKATQEALQYSEQKYRDLAELMPQTIFEADLSGRFTYANRFALTFFGYDHRDLEKGLYIYQMVVPEDVDRAKHNLEDIVTGNKKSGNEYRFRLKNGDVFTGITNLSVIEKDGHTIGLRGIIVDITERKHNEDVLRLSHTLLDCANRTLELPVLLQEYVQIIKEYTGSEAIGIRLLDEQGNIPYQAYTGFSPKFYSTESPLSVKTDECMCIDVIRGTTDPTRPFFTINGSFCINGTTKFLSTVSEEDKGRTRNVCNKTGYESVALVPIRQGDRIIGLIHLADRREKQVPLATVHVIEEIAGPIGSTIQRVGAETQVRESLAEKEVLLREIHHRVKNNLARVISLIGLQKAQLTDQDDIARFRDLESRIRSMSLVHESLYHSDSVSRINAQKYAEDLVQHLIQAYGPRSDIRWNIRMGTTHLPIDTAIHCGLIITEIVTNSLKYAFPEGWSCQEERGEPCEIALSMTEKDGFIILNASDNGRGIPPGSTVSGPHSLGLTLIRILAKNQLHGDLEMRTTRGTSFEVRFVKEPDWIKGD